VNEQSDAELLRAYAAGRSETAFAELVHRHVDFTYSAARRMVRDPHLAEDVTQAVFVALAVKAGQLTDRGHLSGWLHRTARNIAAQTVRAIERRRAREQEAAIMTELLSPESESSWQAIAPQLDAALDELGEADRDALVLRYFYKQSAEEMGRGLGISAEAAQKRVNRAMDRLRELFSKCQITIGASGLIGLISVNAVQSAPVGLAAAITSASFAGTALSNSTLIAATKAILMTTTQKIIVGVVLAASVAVPMLVQSHEQAKLSALDETFKAQTAQLAELKAKQEQLAQLTDGTASNAVLTPEQFTELLRLRGQAGGLQRLVRELSRQQVAIAAGGSNVPVALAQVYAERARQLKQWLEANPAGKIPELRFIDDQTWINAAYGSTLDNDDEYRRAVSNVRDNAELQVLGQLGSALRHYAAANNGQMPAQLSDLTTNLRVPLEDEILNRYELVPATSLVQQLQNQGDWVITQKAPVDGVYDSRMAEGLTGGTFADERITNRWQ
jgi:RNA polymerase sigma factor (sigma-70 family)